MNAARQSFNPGWFYYACVLGLACWSWLGFLMADSLDARLGSVAVAAAALFLASRWERITLHRDGVRIRTTLGHSTLRWSEIYGFGGVLHEDLYEVGRTHLQPTFVGRDGRILHKVSPWLRGKRDLRALARAYIKAAHTQASYA